MLPLAKRGAYAVRMPETDGAAQVLVERRQQITGAGTVAASEFAAAIDAGWVGASAPPGTYRLTARGLAAVRRVLSQRQLERAAAVSHTPEVAPHAQAPTINEAESPLAWLRSRRDADGKPMLSDAQFDAGERLRADLWRAQMTPRVTASWSGIPQSRSERRTPPGAGMADGVVAARVRIENAFKAVGPEHFELLFDVCGHLKGLEQVEREAKLPPRSGKRFLERALTALARHYGLLPALDVDAAIKRRLRHWGSDDYRPTNERRE